MIFRLLHRCEVGVNSESNAHFYKFGLLIINELQQIFVKSSLQ